MVPEWPLGPGTLQTVSAPGIGKFSDVRNERTRSISCVGSLPRTMGTSLSYHQRALPP